MRGVLLGEGYQGKHVAVSRDVVALCFVKRSTVVHNDMLLAIRESLGEDGPYRMAAGIDVKDDACGVWSQVGVNQDECAVEGGLKVLEDSAAFLGLAGIKAL